MLRRVCGGIRSKAEAERMVGRSGHQWGSRDLDNDLDPHA